MEIGLTRWIVELAVEHEAIPSGPDHACAYLPGRTAREQAFTAEDVDAATYHELMHHGYRRSGRLYYKPACPHCRACVPIRVPVADFRPSKSQRRTWRRNADLHVEVGPPTPSPERYSLFRKYLDAKHDGSMPGDYESFRRFLYDSQVDTVELTYRQAATLVGVGLVDVCPQSISTVYFYYDPACARRSLGTFSSLWEMDYARKLGIPYYYLGYYIRDARSMRYKARFLPHERRTADGLWKRFDVSDEAVA